MALTLNPYEAPTAELAPLVVTPDAEEFDGAGFGQRMVVQAVAGVATYGALCLPLHPLHGLFFWEGGLRTAAPVLVVLSTFLSAVILDRPLRQSQGVWLWLVALIQVALNGTLFGGLMFFVGGIGSQPNPLAWFVLGGMGLMFGAIGCALSVHLTFPVALVAAHVAQAWSSAAAAKAARWGVCLNGLADRDRLEGDPVGSLRSGADRPEVLFAADEDLPLADRR